MYWLIGLPIAIGFVAEVVLVAQARSYGIFGTYWASNICQEVAASSDVFAVIAAHYLTFILTSLPGWTVLSVLAGFSGYSDLHYRHSVGPLLAVAVIFTSALVDFLMGGIVFLVAANLRVVSVIGSMFVLGAWCVGKTFRKGSTSCEDALSNGRTRGIDLMMLIAAIAISGHGWIMLANYTVD